MITNKIKENLTIAFSGHNIKPFATAAIKSLLLVNNSYSGKIVYFDDCSTDGTKEVLQELGVYVITWVPEVYRMFEQLRDMEKTLPNRCSLINESIFRSINNEFIYLTDADVIFKGDIISDIADIMEKSGSQIVTRVNTYQRSLYGRVLERNKIYMNASLFNIKKLNKLGCLGDDIHNLSANHDTGETFYQRVKCHGAQIDVLDHQLVDQKVFHFGWMASSMRNDSVRNLKNPKELLEERIHSIDLADREVYSILNKIGISSDTLKEHVISNFYKSKIS